MPAHTNKGTPTLEMGNENIKEKSPHPLLKSTRLTPKFSQNLTNQIDRNWVKQIFQVESSSYICTKGSTYVR